MAQIYKYVRSYNRYTYAGAFQNDAMQLHNTAIKCEMSLHMVPATKSNIFCRENENYIVYTIYKEDKNRRKKTINEQIETCIMLIP